MLTFFLVVFSFFQDFLRNKFPSEKLARSWVCWNIECWSCLKPHGFTVLKEIQAILEDYTNFFFFQFWGLYHPFPLEIENLLLHLWKLGSNPIPVSCSKDLKAKILTNWCKSCCYARAMNNEVKLVHLHFFKEAV